MWGLPGPSPTPIQWPLTTKGIKSKLPTTAPAACLALSTSVSVLMAVLVLGSLPPGRDLACKPTRPQLKHHRSCEGGPICLVTSLLLISYGSPSSL